MRSEKEDTPRHPIPNTRLREERIKKGLTQRRLAEILGVDEQTVRSWERGTRFPSPRFRAHLASLFEKTPEQLGLAPAGPAEAMPTELLSRQSLSPASRRFLCHRQPKALIMSQ